MWHLNKLSFVWQPVFLLSLRISCAENVFHRGTVMFDQMRQDIITKFLGTTLIIGDPTGAGDMLSTSYGFRLFDQCYIKVYKRMATLGMHPELYDGVLTFTGKDDGCCSNGQRCS
jgi:hypothetical protein